jgi:hypothetical protein
MKSQVCAGLLALGAVAGGPAWARPNVIAGTSFEFVPTLPGVPNYVDTLGSATSHALINNANQPIVNFAPGAGVPELGFSSYWTTNGDGSAGLTDNQFFGTYGGGFGEVPNGDHFFFMSDTEGVAKLTFDAVDVTTATAPELSMWLRINGTNWELDDFIHIYAVLDDGLGNLSEATLLDTRGGDIDDLGIEGSYVQFTTSLTPGTHATLVVEFDGDVTTESIRFDQIQFLDVPGPAGIAVFGIAGLFRSRRRH